MSGPTADQTRPGPRGHLSRWLAGAGALVLAVGLFALLHGPTASTTGVSDERDSRLDPPPGAGTTARATPARWVPGAPRRVSIPELGVNAAVRPVKAPGRTLVPPADPQELGWWADGARPGDGRGSALVAGHSVHAGDGALDDLELLETGDQVVVSSDRGRLRYAVDRVRIFSKGTLADQAERLFSQESRGRLVLLTCEDWDGSRYLSNVVVVATPRP